MLTNINAFTLSKNLVSSVGKNSPSATRKPNDLAVLNKKNLESIPPYLLYQVQQNNFKAGLMSYISCISLRYLYIKYSVAKPYLYMYNLEY